LVIILLTPPLSRQVLLHSTVLWQTVGKDGYVIYLLFLENEGMPCRLFADLQSKEVGNESPKMQHFVVGTHAVPLPASQQVAM